MDHPTPEKGVAIIQSTEISPVKGLQFSHISMGTAASGSCKCYG